MACSDFQTECLRVVTIGYLKDFIGTYVQNSTNGSPISIQRSDDTYCPTYSELTGGTIIQTWSQGSTPRSDRDGITVNQTWAGGSSGYAANQLVDQRDLGLKYTRFNTLSIARSGSGEISECGGSATLTYTYNHARYTKGMNNSCVTSTSSSSVNSPCGELTYHTTYGSVSNCTSYSIGKNGSFSASPRTDNVYATTTFRGTTRTSNSVDIPQKALTGSYSREKSRWETTTGVTATATSVTSFGCAGGEYSARGTRHYKVTGRYAWVDSCNVEYSQTQDRTISTNQLQDLGQQTGNFSVHDCCDGSYSTSARLQFSRDGYTANVDFSQNCADCSSSCLPPCQGIDYTLYPNRQIGCEGGSVTFTFEGGCKCSLLHITTSSLSYATAGGTQTVSFTLAGACVLTWSAPSWITVSESRTEYGVGTLSCTASANDSDARSGTITLSVNGSSCHSISVSQDAAPLDCFMGGPNSITMDTSETSGSFGFVSHCGSIWADVEVLDKGALDTATVVRTGGVDGRIDFTWNSTVPGDTTITLKQVNGNASLTVAMHKRVPTPTTCTVTFNISGTYNYIDTVALMGSSGGGTYRLNGTGYSRTAEIPCGVTFTGIVFNDTVQQHCAYLTSSTGGTISNGATFGATITGSTCS